jgi:hypothetical protein
MSLSDETHLRPAPSLAILIDLEGAVRVRPCCETDQDEARLWDWINANDDIRHLVTDAATLEHGARSPR